MDSKCLLKRGILKDTRDLGELYMRVACFDREKRKKKRRKSSVWILGNYKKDGGITNGYKY